MDTSEIFDTENTPYFEEWIMEERLTSAEVVEHLGRLLNNGPGDAVDLAARITLHEIVEANIPAHKIPAEFFKRLEEKGKRAAALVSSFLSQRATPPQ